MGRDEEREADRKPVADLVVTGIRQCLTMGSGDGPSGGPDQSEIGLVRDAGVAVIGERIAYVGPASGLPAAARMGADTVQLDARGGLLMPGFIDPHTHLLFGGWRAGEFGQRVAGAGYGEILAAGGGILSTVEATRKTSEEELVALGRRRLRAMLRMGTTTVEAKSGYGLALADEAKLVRAARRLDATEPVDVVPTLLGAHALPPEFADDRSGYLALVEAMIGTLADRVEFVDAFCEKGAFSVDECRRLLETARRHGVAGKLHADQLRGGGGAELAAETGCISADHLDYVSTAGIAALKHAGVVAVLLPSVPLYVMSRRQAPAGKLVGAGVPVALATDFNPGTSPLQSMGTVVALACLLMRMSPPAALMAATRNAACAIGRDGDVGTLRAGKLADLQLYDVGDYRMLPYRFGELRPTVVVKAGEIVVDRRRGADPTADRA